MSAALRLRFRADSNLLHVFAGVIGGGDVKLSPASCLGSGLAPSGLRDLCLALGGALTLMLLFCGDSPCLPAHVARPDFPAARSGRGRAYGIALAAAEMLVYPATPFMAALGGSHLLNNFVHACRGADSTVALSRFPAAAAGQIGTAINLALILAVRVKSFGTGRGASKGKVCHEKSKSRRARHRFYRGPGRCLGCQEDRGRAARGGNGREDRGATDVSGRLDNINLGDSVTGEDLKWQQWPVEGITPGLITRDHNLMHRPS